MIEKTRIEIAVLLPTVGDARDACVQRLNDLLKAKEGIEAVHVADKIQNGPGQVCIHYDPDQLSIGEVRQLAQRAGAELDERFGHLMIVTKPMHVRRAGTIESRVKQIAGVLEAAASPAGVLRIEFARLVVDEDTIRSEIEKIDGRIMEAVKDKCGKSEGKEHVPEHEHGGIFGENSELIFAAICGGLLLIGWLLSWTIVTSWVSWGCYIAAYFFGGYFTFREAIENIRAGRFEIDFLMLVEVIISKPGSDGTFR